MQATSKRMNPLNIEDHRNLNSKNIKRLDNNLNNYANLDYKGVSAEKFSVLNSL